MSTHGRGYAAALVAITLWATTGLLIRVLVVDYALTPLLLAWWRNVLVTVALAPLFWRQGVRFPSGQGRFLAFYGLVLAVFNVVWIASVQANGAAAATVLLYSSAAFTVLLAWPLLGEPLTVRKLLAVAASLAGSALVSGAYTLAAWQGRTGGIVLGLLSGLMFAAYGLTGRASAQRRIGPWVALFYAFAWASVFQGAINFLPWLPQHAVSWRDFAPHLPLMGWLVLLVLSLGPTLMGFGFYNTALKHLPAGTVNLLATLEPVMTAVMAYVLLGERLTGVQLAGSALILAAVVGVQSFRQGVG